MLTRLPPPARRTPAVISRILAANFPATRFLGTDETAALDDRLHTLDLGGGAVYDALVGAAAASHGVPLVTRDRRALRTYRALEVDVVMAL